MAHALNVFSRNGTDGMDPGRIRTALKRRTAFADIQRLNAPLRFNRLFCNAIVEALVGRR
jgi:hypothetical protein